MSRTTRFAPTLLVIPFMGCLLGCPPLPPDDGASPVQAEISISSASGPAPWTVTVSAVGSTSANGGPLTYQWDFAGEATATTETATHTFSDPGLYRVTLTVTDPLGETDSTGVDVQVQGQPPAAVASATPTSGPAPLFVEFDGSASSAPDDTIRSWIWDFGDTQTGSNETTVHVYSTPGTYTVTLTVRTAGGVEDTDSLTIQVGDAAINSLQYNGSQVATLPLNGQRTLPDFTFETFFRASGSGGTVVSAGGGVLTLTIDPASDRIDFRVADVSGQASIANLAGAWQHVALTNTAGGQARLFVNGLEVAATSAGAEIQIEQLSLGLGFTGGLSETRFWSAARSPAQISGNDAQRLPNPELEGDLLGYWPLSEGEGQTLANLGTSAVDGVRGTTEAAEASDPAWSTDGPAF